MLTSSSWTSTSDVQGGWSYPAAYGGRRMCCGTSSSGATFPCFSLGRSSSSLRKCQYEGSHWMFRSHLEHAAIMHWQCRQPASMHAPAEVNSAAQVLRAHFLKLSSSARPRLALAHGVVARALRGAHVLCGRSAVPLLNAGLKNLAASLLAC